MTKYYIEYFQNVRTLRWYWRVVAENGNIILSSQGCGLVDKPSMMETINNFRRALSGRCLGLNHVPPPTEKTNRTRNTIKEH